MKAYCLIPSFLLLFLTSLAQIKIDSIPEGGLVLNEGWKFQAGNNPAWADANYDDTQWQSVNPTLDIHDIAALWQNRIVWFRLRFSVSNPLQTKTLALLIQQTGASEIYINGKLIETYGTIAGDGKIKAVSPPWVNS